MLKLLPRKQNYRELGFVPIHTKVRREIHRPCSQCGKWIHVVELGLCRYRFVEYNYSFEHNKASLPWTAMVRKCTNHICINVRSNPKNTTSRVKNANLLYDGKLDNRVRMHLINGQRRNDIHRMKPVTVGTM